MKKIIQSGNILRFVNIDHTYDQIPQGVWLVSENPLEFFLEKVNDFIIPEKTYGNVERLSDRYLNTFRRIKTNLGIFLAGEKGTGKSLQAKSICVRSGLPVLLITQPYGGDKLIRKSSY